MAWPRCARRFCDAFYIAALFLVATLFLWPAWRQPDGLWYAPGAAFSDLTVTHWPNMWFVAQTFRRHGEIPLWRPLIMGGTPFVGNPLAALFYPPNWLFALLPVTFTFHFLFALHLFGGGAAFYGLIRGSYRRSPFAAFIAGLSYMLTPKLIAHVGAGHVGLSQAFAWLPLTLWSLRNAIERRSGRWAAWCGATLALAYFADPRVAFYDALATGAYALYRLTGVWRKEGWPAAFHLCPRMLLVPTVLALVGAAQMLPTLELMTATTRGTLTLDEAGRDSLPWRYLIGYLIADRGGYHEWMTYLGLAPLGLALLALWRSPERERWFWAGLAAVSILYSLGTNAPLYPVAYRLLPILGWVRVPSRALLLVALAINLLGGLGIDPITKGRWKPDKRRWAVRIAFAGLLTCGGLGISLALLAGGKMPSAVLAFSIIGVALTGLFLLSVQGHVPLPLFRAALVTLLLSDLWSVGRSLLVLRLPEEVFAEGAVPAAYLSAQRGRFRVYSPSYSISQHVGARLELEQLDGVDPSQLRWVHRFMSLAGGYPTAKYGVTLPPFPDNSDVHTFWQDAVPNATLLGLLNGRFVVTEFPISAPDMTLHTRAGSSYVYENQRCLPRAFTMAYTERVSGWEEAQAQLAAGSDPAEGALVEGGPTLGGPTGWQPAHVRSFSPNRVVVEAEVERPALLVLSEVWYPGWQVTVDGVQQPYYRVDGIVRGVYLEPGAHVVTWRYRPASLRWGSALTLVTLAGLIAGTYRGISRWRD